MKGRGYNPNLANTRYAYPNNPGDSAGWSEMSAAAPPGERSALMSIGPITLKPLPVKNFFYFSMSWIPPGGSFQERYEKMHSYSSLIDDFNYEVVFPPEIDPFDTLPCFGGVETLTYAVDSPIQVSLLPNPTSGIVQINSKDIPLSSVSAFNSLGLRIHNQPNISEKLVEINTDFWPEGVYLVHLRLKDGRSYTLKLLVYS
jgi:hypothetical protein